MQHFYAIRLTKQALKKTKLKKNELLKIVPLNCFKIKK